MKQKTKQNKTSIKNGKFKLHKALLLANLQSIYYVSEKKKSRTKQNFQLRNKYFIYRVQL